MFKYAIPALTLLPAVPAHAATFSCTGGILGYPVYLTGNISGAKVVGSANIKVTKSGQLLQQGNSPVTSSTFVANQRLSFVTQDAHSKIGVDTVYGNGTYTGTMAINSDQGNTSVTATC